jgi:inosine-uridine nucleoside N-ribohydrolase
MEHPNSPAMSEGLDFLIAEARQGPVTVIATGPITDIASLLLVAPDVRENVRVVWLGGFGDETAYRRFRLGELNGRADIAAWRALLGQRVDLLMLPGWPGVVRLTISYDAYAAELRAMHRPIADYLAEITVRWMEQWEALHERPAREKVLWDVANVGAVVNSGCVTVTPMPYPTLDVAGAHDWEHPSRMVDVVTDLDPAWILADLRAALLRHPEQ